MYEDDYVSYPRTEDTKVDQKDFDELLPLVDSIANVVGIDKSLLTHRTARKNTLLLKQIMVPIVLELRYQKI